MELGLSGKRFLVTGGTRGIGRAVVEGLFAEEAAVAYCARTRMPSRQPRPRPPPAARLRSAARWTWVTLPH